MNTKKRLIEESILKIREIIESKLNEQEVVSQPQAQPDPQRDQKIAQNIDATMDQAMKKFVDNLPNVISDFVKNSGDKDGVLDADGVYDNQQQASGNQQQVNESLLRELKFDESKFLECMNNGQLNELDPVSSAIISAPAIIKAGGKATSWIGKKMNSQWLQKWGNKTAEAGEKLHHIYLKPIEKAVSLFMPNASKEQIHKTANAIFMSGVGIFFAQGLSNPGIWTGVKGAELGEFAAQIFKKSMPQLGFA